MAGDTVRETAAAEPGVLDLGLPDPVRDPSLPARVRIHEVGPRDGLQNEGGLVPVEVKAEFIARLAAAGLRTVEATSFVHPKWVPQLADAEELVPRLSDLAGEYPGLRLPVLVPNERGLDRALAHGVGDVAVFGIPDEDWGEQVKAVIEPAAGVDPSPRLAEEVLAFSAERLAKFKCPRSIDFVATMPRDPNGKLYKRRLRDPYWQGRERAI